MTIEVNVVSIEEDKQILFLIKDINSFKKL